MLELGGEELRAVKELARVVRCVVPKFSAFSESVWRQKYSHGGAEDWADIAARVAFHVCSPRLKHHEVLDVASAIASCRFIPGGRYLYAAGRPFHMVNNCLLLRAEDSREGWAGLMHKAGMALMTGAGIGVDYSPLREEGAAIRKTGGVASGPIALMRAVNDFGRQVQQGGSRRSAIWAGLNWKHPDVLKFTRIKDWPKEVRALKEKDFDFPASMDSTNVSVLLDDEFFVALDRGDEHARLVWETVIRQMLSTAEPGFSIDVGENAGETLRNACTEVVSHDDSDICNLGSVNLARCENIEQFREVAHISMMLQMCGSLYTDVPYPAVQKTLEKNRRIGQGLMGLHEWLLQRGYPYGPNEELRSWLEAWAQETRDTADEMAARLGVNPPVKCRAIAPTGTIGIVGQTTTGIEPVFCKAYKRRYRKGNGWAFQYVIDPTARRLVEQGVSPDKIEDAYSLAQDVERRLAFQVFVQEYVDQSISSTVNLPSWGSEHNNPDTEVKFRETLRKHIQGLRGITCYPDGARGGQPLVPVDWAEAAAQEGKVFESADVCVIGKGGVCGE